MILILVAASFLGNNMNAQSQPLTLDEALQIAFKNHPSMQSADYQIQEQETLRRTGFELPV
ncbi:MAG: hypothetical protein ACE5FF_17240 [Saprospiraceae bacterium]